MANERVFRYERIITLSAETFFYTTWSLRRFDGNRARRYYIFVVMIRNHLIKEIIYLSVFLTLRDR